MTEELSAQIVTPNEIANRFLDLKEKRQKIADLKKALDTEYEVLREKLLTTMRDTGALSIKTENYTIYRAKQQGVQIDDPIACMEEIKSLGVKPVIRIDKVAMGSWLKKAIGQGAMKTATIVESEYVSIRKPVKKSEANE